MWAVNFDAECVSQPFDNSDNLICQSASPAHLTRVAIRYLDWSRFHTGAVVLT